MKEKIIVPLDVPSLKEAKILIGQLRGLVGAFKVGMELFYAAGEEIINAVHEAGEKVFLDLKLHDIPNTVASALKVIKKYNVWMTNVHIAGGRKMLSMAVEALDSPDKNHGQRPLLIGVTVLTSIDQEILENEIGINRSIQQQVIKWAVMAKECALNGVVCSPHEIKTIKEHCGRDFITVVPGIRPQGSDINDQKRVMTPAEAVANGADYIVIGRPITRAHDPEFAVRKIIEDMEAVN